MKTTELITSHLNAPYGAVVDVSDLVVSLCAGRLAAGSPQANAVLSYLFIEIEPRLIITCALEVGASWASVHALYGDTLAHAAPQSRQWESSVKGLL